MQKIVELLLLLLGQALAANILVLMGIPSHSHHLYTLKYVEALVARGHHVTYVGLDEYNPPKNVTYVLLEGAYDAFENYDFTQFSQVGPYRTILQLYQWDDDSTKGLKKTKGLARLKEILKKEKFDLIIHDIACSTFLLGAVDAAGRVPVMGITAYGIPPWSFDILGNPLSHAARPNFYSHYTNEMDFLQRMNNYFLNLFSSAVFWYQVRTMNEYSKEVFGNVRHLGEILNDMNVIIVNSNLVFDYPFPKVPGLIQIGGIQIVEPKPLPQDLQSYLDKASHGIIYFSLGSNIKSSQLTTERIRVLVEAFRQLAPIQVLWKWETDSLPGKPDNVKIAKWLPQNDILAHPKVRLFFTHSGGLSTHEAIYHGKAIVGLPILLDQHVNARKAVNNGFGEQIDVNLLTVDKVVNTIKKVLNNPRYTENARRLSAIYRDNMGTPLEQIVYWAEYVIRHKGAPHLRFAGRDLPWYQNWMLDVFVIVFGGVFCVALFIYRVMMMAGSSRKVKRSKAKKS